MSLTELIPLGPAYDPRPLARLVPLDVPASAPGVVVLAGLGVTGMAYVPVPGPPGPPVAQLPALVTSQAVGAGMPLCVSKVNGQALLARADIYPLSAVVALAAEAVAAGFPVQPVRGSVSLLDWSAVTGSVALQAGDMYFLAPTGGLTVTPPALPAAVALCRVGIAISPTTLDVHPSAPILF